MNLFEEYDALIDKKFDGTLTQKDSVRLEAVKEEINEIDRNRPRPDVWDIQHAKLREEIEQLRRDVEALVDMPQGGQQ